MKEGEEEQPSQNWKIKMLYDGEVNMFRERDKSYQAIKFFDISSDEYSAEENQALDYKTVMGRSHAILSDKTLVTDAELLSHSDMQCLPLKFTSVWQTNR
ncbi:hypothetical protein RJ639_034625 [Escallonia herrerae]|uniref:Uncharacterized protein n=1 Tax=Escallonia herrerae TaxID=1293975 RepID=A0AA88WZF7_9ASTE|nr:hypothetical protein RJ639_034625 [Escallonia herrerae]